MRGSDENASLYWLARMLEGGEDPLYVARRLVRFASEDIGKRLQYFVLEYYVELRSSSILLSKDWYRGEINATCGIGTKYRNAQYLTKV